MSDSSEWNRKGATLSHVTAEKEYGVAYDFIVRGIETGELEWRENSVWGNPFLRILRSQLERYITAQLGADYLTAKKSEAELRSVNREIANIKRRLAALQVRKAELETAIRR